MAKRSITLTYLLWTWGFFLLVLSAVFVFATRQSEHTVVVEAEERAHSALGLVRYLLLNRTPVPGDAGLAVYVDSLGLHLGFRLTYIVDGRVVADSDVTTAGVAEMENHADRPEVLQALAGGYGQDVRLSHTLGRDMLYVAEPFPGAPGIPAGVLRLALPVSSLRGELGRLRVTLLWVLGLVFVAGGVVAYGLARSMSRSVKEISDVVAAVGRGQYDRRIHIVPARDFAPLAEAVNVLAERVGSHVREIEERRERQAAILDGMAEGVAILDDRGRIQALNRALLAMFPQSVAPVGKTPIEAGMSLAIERCLTGEGQGPAGRYELPGDRMAEVSVVPVAGDAHARIATFHDVTEVAALDRIFRDFVIDASHRLRTPLTKVQGYAETARDLAATDPNGAGAALAVVIRGAGDMREVIDDLLAAARDRFAATTAAAPAGDALAAFKQALAETGTLLRAKGVTARLVTAPDGPTPVRVDHGVLARVFADLLGQAPAGATVAVSVAVDETVVEIRFQGPVALDAVPPGEVLKPWGGSVTLDGAVWVLRLPRAA
jgi:two-component system, OmpR family, phosphate regulon sensor histidine kinase PhoR